MGQCIYCDKDAGIFRQQHSACREQHDLAVTKLAALFVNSLTDPVEPDRLRTIALELARTHYVSESELHALAIKGVRAMIAAALADNVLTDQDDERIRAIKDSFGISINDLGAENGLIKSMILRALDSGKLPDLQINLIGNLSPNLEHNEVLIYAIPDVTYYTHRTRTQYVGGSGGISVRLMKGVYYRVGAFKAEPVRTEYLSLEGKGGLFIGSRNIYFVSPHKAIKLLPKKIVSVQLYNDGIEIHRDGVNAKPLIFKLTDPHFVANVIARLNQLQAPPIAMPRLKARPSAPLTSRRNMRDR